MWPRMRKKVRNNDMIYEFKKLITTIIKCYSRLVDETKLAYVAG